MRRKILLTWLLGDLYKNANRNLYKPYRIWFIISRLRGDLYKNIGEKFIQGVSSGREQAMNKTQVVPFWTWKRTS